MHAVHVCQLCTIFPATASESSPLVVGGRLLRYEFVSAFAMPVPACVQVQSIRQWEHNTGRRFCPVCWSVRCRLGAGPCKDSDSN